MSRPIIDALPDVPTKADPANFDQRADTFLPALDTFGAQQNELAVWTEATADAAGVARTAAETAQGLAEGARDVALSSANFEGPWTATSYVHPASVSHDGKLWLLDDTGGAVAGDVPGVAAKWVDIYVGLVASADVATTPTADKIPKAGADGTIDIRWIGLPLESAGAYGVRWNPHDDTYMELGASNGSPVQDAMRRVLLKDADATIDTALPGGGVLKSTDSTKFANDSDASAYINGANGHQVMVEVPQCWTAIQTDENGVFWFWVCDHELHPLSGLSLDPAFQVGRPGTVPRTSRYCGAYQSVRHVSGSGYANGTGATRPANLSTDHVGSVSGFIPHTNQYRSDDRTLTENIGGAGVFWLQDYWLHRLVQLLYLTDKATRSSVQPFASQTVLPGHTEDTPWDFAKVKANGLTNSLGNASGSVGTAGTGVAANSFRGVENFYGSVWTWFDGFLKSPSSAVWHCMNPLQFADVANAAADVGPAGFSLLVDQYGNPIQLPGASEYQKHLWAGTLLPSVVGAGADAATFITDYYWTAAGWRVARSGGSLNDGSRAGFAALHVYHSSVHASAAIGSRPSA